MNLRKLLATGAFFISGIVFVLPTFDARAESISVEQYKEVLTDLAHIIGGETAAQKLHAMNDEQWAVLYEHDTAKENLVNQVSNIKRVSGNDPFSKKISLIPQAIAVETFVDGEFEPRYPPTDPNTEVCYGSAAGCYAHYIDGWPVKTLFFISPIIDGDEIGKQDDRCDEELENTVRQIHFDRHIAAIHLQAICDWMVDVVNVAACEAAAVAYALDFNAEEYLGVCEVHGGNIDGAEIEAAYENTRTILDKSNSIMSDTGAIKTDAASIRTTIETESNFTDDSELSIHNTEVLDAISALDGRLTILEGKLDVISELLNTPQGKRPDWNEKP